jgi:hypothetical protein
MDNQAPSPMSEAEGSVQPSEAGTARVERTLLFAAFDFDLYSLDIQGASEPRYLPAASSSSSILSFRPKPERQRRQVGNLLFPSFTLVLNLKHRPAPVSSA